MHNATVDDPDNLLRHTAPAEAGAGFSAERSGGLALLTPLTPRATAWLQASVAGDASWRGDQLAVEMRYFPDLADAIIAAGFTFEREPLPN